MNNITVEKVADKTRESVKWSLILQVAQKIFFFASSIILARLLSPKDFGLGTIAVTLDTISWIVSSLGVNAAIIHFQTDLEERINAAFWLFLFSSLFLLMVQMIFAPLIANFYKSPLLTDIIRINAIAMFITCFGTIHKTILIKNIEFKKISILDASNNMFKSILYIILALMGFGVWSFIYPKIICAIAYVISLWSMTSWLPKLKFNFKYWIEMFSYGKNVLFSNILDYFINNSSYILIGSMVGSASLGIYTFAYDKSMMIVNNITYPITMISFPAFSRLQNHKDKLKNAFFKSIKLISLLTFPCAIAQIILGPEYITMIFGNKWKASILIFQMILAYSMMRSICQCATPALQGVGKPQVALRWNLIYAPIFISSLYVGFKLKGIYGIGFATTIVGILWTMFYMFIVTRELDWSLKDITTTLSPSFISSIIMGTNILLIKVLLNYLNVPDIVSLPSTIIIGFLVYILSLKILFEDTFNFILDNFVKILSNRKEKENNAAEIPEKT